MLVWTVLIGDSAGSLLRLCFGLFNIVALYPESVRVLVRAPMFFVTWFACPLGIGLFGLSGNVFILRKKKFGFVLAITGVVLELVLIGCFVVLESRPIERVLPFIAWTVFYGIVVWIAARRLRGHYRKGAQPVTLDAG